ncbi:MAG: peptidoglycan DD-metalloendopeptidase family protein [Planctomycetes bacterium]|nr:peptidoglycan DD-metalloendopeptidase family protein [Planctomycetota bacterium]
MKWRLRARNRLRHVWARGVCAAVWACFAMAGPAPSLAEPWIEVLPIAGVPGVDFYFDPLFDNDPAPGQSRDYLGGDRAYDGHKGTDMGVPRFTEMDIGVPVVAVAPGRVAGVVDGHFDRETVNQKNRPGNYVKIDHGGGRVTRYGHLRKGSMVVRVGQVVRTGQQIALVGSSGDSAWPHLHFECGENGRYIDPFQGPGNPAASRWVEQPKNQYPPVIVDAGFFVEPKRPPNATPRLPCVRMGTRDIKAWLIGLNQQAARTRRWQLLGPTGKELWAWDQSLEEEFNVSYSWWQLGDAPFSPGRWTVRVWEDGSPVAEFSVDVVSARSAEPKNRAPSRPDAVIIPAAARADRFVACRVAMPEVMPDPNLDRVRYRYVWSLDGRVLRDVVSVTHLDYLPAGTVAPGSRVKCEIYAGDGQLTSAPFSRYVRFDVPPGQARPSLPPPVLRTWTDGSGEHRLRAVFVDTAEGKVRLKKSDGTIITVPLDKLSPADRVYARRRVEP